LIIIVNAVVLIPPGSAIELSLDAGQAKIRLHPRVAQQALERCH
jgi:hypothetical protein